MNADAFLNPIKDYTNAKDPSILDYTKVIHLLESGISITDKESVHPFFTKKKDKMKTLLFTTTKRISALSLIENIDNMVKVFTLKPLDCQFRSDITETGDNIITKTQEQYLGAVITCIFLVFGSYLSNENTELRRSDFQTSYYKDVDFKSITNNDLPQNIPEVILKILRSVNTDSNIDLTKVNTILAFCKLHLSRNLFLEFLQIKNLAIPVISRSTRFLFHKNLDKIHVFLEHLLNQNLQKYLEHDKLFVFIL